LHNIETLRKSIYKNSKKKKLDIHFKLTLGTNMQHRATVALRLTLKHMVIIL